LTFFYFINSHNLTFLTDGGLLLYLDYLDFDPEKDEPDSEQMLENAQQTSEALKTPGAGKHRSDFISAPLR
jgi:hypothetical protein